MNKKEIITFLRGWAIFLVVLQHALTYANSTAVRYCAQICYYIDVNVFFFISGYLFEKNYTRYECMGKSVFIKKKINELIVPYLSWNILLYSGIGIAYAVPQLARLLQTLGFKNYSILDILINILTYKEFHVELYWFIYVLFIIFVIEILRGRAINDYLYILVVVMLFGILNNFQHAYILEKLPISISVFIIGKIAAGTTILEASYCVKRILISMVIMGMIHYRRVCFSIATVFSGTTYNLYTIMETILLAIAGIVFSIELIKILSQNGLIKKGLNILGIYSFDIYLLHNPYIVSLSAVILRRFLPLYLALVIAVCLGVVLPPVISRILTNNPVVAFFMFGRVPKKVEGGIV